MVREFPFLSNTKYVEHTIAIEARTLKNLLLNFHSSNGWLSKKTEVNVTLMFRKRNIYIMYFSRTLVQDMKDVSNQGEKTFINTKR